MERVNKRNCILDSIYIREKYLRDTMIMDCDGILLLVKDNHVLFDEFKYNHSKNEIGMKFNFNKKYLIFKSSLRESGIDIREYFKDEYGGFSNECFFEVTDQIDEIILTRKKIESFFTFDSKNMDGLYVIDLKKGVLYANNLKNGLVVNEFNIPSDDEICNQEYEFQVMNHKLFKMINGYDDGIEDVKKKIEDIKYYPIIHGNYYHCQNYLYVMVKNGVFDICFFEVVCMGKDKFKLVTRKVILPKDSVNEEIKGHVRKKIM